MKGHGHGRVTVEDAVEGRPVHRAEVDPGPWELAVPAHWRSSLYRAVFTPGTGEESEVWFVVRPAEPGLRSPVLLSVPFATWQAYNRAGVPGEGLYWTEDPERAAQVSFDRPGGGPPPERWEEGLMRWLRAHGPDVEYCSNLDLHLDPQALLPYRLLVVNGHDEYWSWEMRDRVEGFVRSGGNLAVFGANTAWWQMRLEDGGRTMVCYRDAAADPVAAVAPERATVEWSSEPVNRPENTLTGLSFRRGAGCWGPGMPQMYREAYTAAFAGHWVFEGTGLADGDAFALGALGYETDAADLEFTDGVPAATGRDGTPASFTVLATADLRHWDAYGQGGWAVMGVFDSGAGTVFNAGTVNWGAALGDPVVDRITRNVLSRLSAPARADRWTAIGAAPGTTALAGAGSWLFAVRADGTLGVRPAGPQNLPLRQLGPAPGVLALAAPREAVTGGPYALYAADDSGRLLLRPARPEPADWTAVDRCPAGTRALAVCDGRLYALDGRGALWSAPQGLPAGEAARTWTRLAPPAGLVALTSVNGRLYAVDGGGTLLHRRPVADAGWQRLGPAGGSVLLAGQAGRLVGLGADGTLRSRGVLQADGVGGAPHTRPAVTAGVRRAGPDGARD
ncbi:N,N-dimethylformamidase beta subunit family domain-containing protein [Kitasatospora sp. NPDC057015]|uniref:N,N-dimethylformamidase beta subunit family domain-containing protein n=1 Tax=Kitasatospora sp. NPDC057015 TaxID=3346001 RepID=UPI00363FBB5C